MRRALALFCTILIGLASLSVSAQAVPDDDDDSILPIIVAALKPRCQPPAAVQAYAGKPFSLSVNCTFKGNLAREFVWSGPSIPSNTVSITTTNTIATLIAPVTPGSYIHNVLAMNGEIPSALIPITVNVLLNPLSCSLGANTLTPAYGSAVTLTATCTSNGVAVPDVGVVWSASTGCSAGVIPTDATGRVSCTTLPITTSTVASITATKAGHLSASSSVSVSPTFTSYSCALSVDSYPPVGTGATVSVVCTTLSNAPVVGALIAWGSVPGCSQGSNTTDVFGYAYCKTKPLTADSTITASVSKPGFVAAQPNLSALVQIKKTMQCSMTVIVGSKATYAVGDSYTLGVSCKDAGVAIPVSNLNVHYWQIQNRDSFYTPGCDDNVNLQCAQQLTSALLDAHPATNNQIRYSVTASEKNGRYFDASPTLSMPLGATTGGSTLTITQFSISGSSTVPTNTAVVFNFGLNDANGRTVRAELVNTVTNAVVAFIPSIATTGTSAKTGTLTWGGSATDGLYYFRLDLTDSLNASVSSSVLSVQVGSTAPPAGETLTFIHPNISGSPIMATDAAGTVVWREDYSAFGERKKNETNANTGGAANQNWFIGKPQDATTGLVYFGARWYDPQIARFLGFDPAGFDEANPHSFSRYAYGNNNPYKYLDPDGRNPLVITGALRQAATAQTIGSTTHANPGAPQLDPATGIMSNPSQGPSMPTITGFPSLVIQAAQVLSFPIASIDKLAGIITSVLANGEAHGNKIDSRPATLYEKYDKNGDFLKHGVTKHEDPHDRYSSKAIGGGTVVRTDRGPRSEMIKKERDLVERNPGPDNKESWAGKRAGEE